MTSLLTDLGSVVSAIFGYAADVADTITDTPLLLMTTGILLAGAAVGIFGRLLSRN